jgi:4-hydroxy-tetrahydrodipicolinate reductase
MRSLGVVGARGRLGARLLSMASDAGWTVSLSAGRDYWAEDLPPQVVVDVSHPSAVERVGGYCMANGTALVYGVSNVNGAALEMLLAVAELVPVVLAPNFSFGHQLQRRALAAMLAALAPRGDLWEVTLVERHPATKRDAPSATAKALYADCLEQANIAADIQSVRAGLPVSDHAAHLTSAGEELTLTHAVNDLAAAATGALRAADWAARAPRGCWSMEDVYASGKPPAGPASRVTVS